MEIGSFSYCIDILNDDYFVGTKMAMKIKHIQGVVRVFVNVINSSRILLLKLVLVMESLLLVRFLLILFLVITVM